MSIFDRRIDVLQFRVMYMPRQCRVDVRDSRTCKPKMPDRSKFIAKIFRISRKIDRNIFSKDDCEVFRKEIVIFLCPWASKVFSVVYGIFTHTQLLTHELRDPPSSQESSHILRKFPLKGCGNVNIQSLYGITQGSKGIGMEIFSQVTFKRGKLRSKLRESE